MLLFLFHEIFRFVQATGGNGGKGGKGGSGGYAFTGDVIFYGGNVMPMVAMAMTAAKAATAALAMPAAVLWPLKTVCSSKLQIMC